MTLAENGSMRIRLNGAPFELEGPVSLARLLERLALSDKRVAIELNGTIAPRSARDSTFLAEGDCVEIVQFVGGG